MKNSGEASSKSGVILNHTDTKQEHINYGDRLKLGMIIPSGNVIAEPQIKAMLPRGVSLHVTRLELRGSSEAELSAMSAGTEAAVRLLSDACVDIIAFHCTAVTTFSSDAGEAIRLRMRDMTTIPALVTSDALIAACRALDMRRVVLVTPYVEAIHTREIEFLSEFGVTVTRDAHLGIDSVPEMGTIVPSVFVDAVKAAWDPEADGCILSCTAIRTAEIIDQLEAELGKPVITSNQAIAWYALRNGGVLDPVAGFGTLLRLEGLIGIA